MLRTLSIDLSEVVKDSDNFTEWKYEKNNEFFKIPPAYRLEVINNWREKNFLLPNIY